MYLCSCKKHLKLYYMKKLKKEDYSWCFNGSAACKMQQYEEPTACVGFDVCGSDGCSIEYCGFDCGRDEDW